MDATNRFQNQEQERWLEERRRWTDAEFWSVIDELSSEIKANDLQILKVVFYDIINNKKELEAATANSLFRLLHSEGYIETKVYVNCDLLFEVFKVTGLQRLHDILSKNYRRQKLTNKITGYRWMLVRLGKSLDNEHVKLLAKICNIDKNDLENAWNLIKILSQEKLKDSIESLMEFEALLKEHKELNHELDIVRSCVQQKKLSDVPLEVLARGQEAKNAFLDAIQEGSKPIYQTRLMLVGQERAGKTSLTKALIGHPFDDNEKVTDGIELSCTINVKHTTNWTPNQNKKTNKAMQEYRRTLAEEIVNDILKNKEEKQTELREHVKKQENGEVCSVGELEEATLLTFSNSTYNGQTCTEISAITTLEIEEEKKEKLQDSKEIGRKKQEYEQFGLTEDTQEEVFKLVKNILEEKKRNGEKKISEEIKKVQQTIGDLTLSIWDFAGQDLYYITHQMFLVSRAIYIICFNLCHDLNAPSRVEVFHREYGKITDADHYMTNLDRVVFWSQSIYSHTTENSVSNQKQFSPPIFIVGTHRESLPGNDEERQALTEDKFLLIKKAFKQKPYEDHVVLKYYAIDNSVRSPLDKSIVELRDHITEVAKNESYMGEKMPLKWLNFLHEIEQLRAQNEHSINFKQVTKISSKCHINTNIQLFAMLHFHHDLGNIVYYGERDTPYSALNDIIIIIPQWLIYIFRLVITVKNPSDQWAEFRSSWKKLDEEGFLEERLLRRMWQEFLEKFEALLQLMQKFDLICVKTQSILYKQTTGTKSDRLFYVPSLLKKKEGDEMVSLDKLAKSNNTVVFYVNFDGFLPEGLYYRLVVRIVHWSQQRSHDKGYNPRLFYQQVKVYIDQNHDAIIRILPEKRSCIQVVIYKLKVGGKHLEPSPSVCKEILQLIKENLLDIGHKWMKRVDFNVCVLCNVCPEENLHLHKLKECLVSTPRCGPDDGMDTCKVRRLFGKDNRNQAFQDTAVQGNSNVPWFLRPLIGVYKDIPSPILPFHIMTEVCVLLDPPQPRANDWRSVACKVGYDCYINYIMNMMNSPTMCVMHGWSEKGLSLDDFKDCMIAINRHDVVGLIEEHLKL
ncbi:uncharacterized protein [Antedon mediterranea]|uniref:uncharacterized protein isoform X2 n=1 Tax=Antedon mediterranea TaxID=105859 RepID=UPI003AF69276